MEGDKSVQLGSRALEILIALIERGGALVTKEELVGRVWPNTFVHESNLKVHIAALRKVLGDGQAGNRYIINVPGRGYQFVASISQVEETSPRIEDSGDPSYPHNLPAPLNRIVGRAEILRLFVDQLSENRFVSIVGPGGIGKTTVALEIGHSLVGSFRHGIWFVDLAQINDPSLVPSALASLLELPVLSGNALPGLVSFLRDKQSLLVFDSCELVIEAAATLAESLLKSCADVQILATSREPLRAVGEKIQRLPSLELPPPSSTLSASAALGFSAIQLFVERTASSVDLFALNDADAPVVADICRRLDGNALAIELAAGRVGAFGVDGVGRLLDDRFRLLRGRRSAIPRHKTLSATVDWSYDLLPLWEQKVLCRLGILVGNFTLEAAIAVTVCEEIGAAAAADALGELVIKSLVSADVGGSAPSYRLLDTTRAYANEKLTQSGDYDRVASRHAKYYLALFDKARVEATKQTISDWLRTYAAHMDNVRAALDWAFSDSGDSALGVHLTAVTVPLWLSTSLMDECRKHVQRALGTPETGLKQAALLRMQLYAAQGVALYSIGPSPEANAAWAHVLKFAEVLEDADYRLRALWGLWNIGVTGGKQRSGLSLARQFINVASKANDEVALLVGSRLIGESFHFLGEQTQGRRHIEQMLQQEVNAERRSHIVRFQFDQFVASTAYLARILWILGLPDQALQAARRSVDTAESLGHTNSVCYALAMGACPVALLAGDLPAAEQYATTLLDQSQKHAIALWNIKGHCFKGALAIKIGDVEAGLQELRQGIGMLHDVGFVLYHTAALADFAVGLGCAGRIADGLAVINQALAQSRRYEERWCFPELLRIKGDLILLQAGPGAPVTAESLFRKSLDWAKRQRALSWELRTATSLARLFRDQSRSSDARGLLAPIHGRFSEGFNTADLAAARQLLFELS